MSSDITKHYYTYLKTQQDVDEILDVVTHESGFIAEQRIFQGRIYDHNKIGSSIYQGTWKGKAAVLKLQLLPLEVDEVKINKDFSIHNTSSSIRVVHIYDHRSWSKERGYGYIIQEYVPQNPLFSQRPLSTPEQRNDFYHFYREYKNHCVSRPLWERAAHEHSSLKYTRLRVQRWIEISKSKGELTPSVAELIPRYYEIIDTHLDKIPMVWMHGHLTGWDILKPRDGTYVLMSNLYWGYRPAYYDATFHLWASIKEIRDRSITLDEVMAYINAWKSGYTAIAQINQDPLFSQAFDLMFLERTLTALVLDINNQDYEQDRDLSIHHLQEIFFGLFGVFAEKFAS